MTKEAQCNEEKDIDINKDYVNIFRYKVYDICYGNWLFQ